MPILPGLSFRRSQPELEHFESRDSIEPSRPTLPSTTPPEGPRRRLAAKFVLGIAAGLGLSVVFVGALATSLVLHLNAPSARRAIAAYASDAVSKDLRGRVDFVAIDRISPRGLDVGEITVRDPAGKPVLSVYGAHVRYNIVSLAKAFLNNGNPTIDRVVVERVNVALIPNAAGEPTLIDAVASRDPKPTQGPGEKTPSTFRMALPWIDVRAIEVFGQAGNKFVGAYGEVEKLSVQIAPDATTIHAPRVTLHVAPIANTLASATTVEIDGSLRVPTHVSEGDLPVLIDRARIAVSSAGTHATITATGDERAFSAHIEAPSVSPATISAFTGAPPPLPVPASVSLDVTGTIDRAHVHGVAGLGAAVASIDGEVDLAAFDVAPTAAYPRIALGQLSVAVRGLDPALFGGPSLGVSTDLVARMTATTAGTEVTLKGTGGTTFGGKPGSVDVDAIALIAPNKTVNASGKVHATLGKSKVSVDFTANNPTGGGTAHATVYAQVPSLEELHAFHQQPLHGRVDLDGTVDVDLGKQTFALSGRAHAIGFKHPSVHLPEGVVAVQAEGPFHEPKFVTAIVARQIVLSPTAQNPYRIHNVDLKVAGTPKLLAVEGKLSTDGGQNVVVSTHVAPTTVGARLVGTKLHVDKGTFIAEIAVKEFELKGSAMSVKGFKMSSTAGGLRLDASYDPKTHKMALDAHSTPLDLPALFRAAGLEDMGIRGTLTLDTNVATIARKNPADGSETGILRLDDDVGRIAKIPTVTAPYLVGHIKLDLDNGFAPQVGAVNAHVNVDIEDRLVAGNVGVAIKDLIRIGLNGAALVPGRIDDPKAWADASGHVDLRVPQIDLAKVSAFLARNGQELPTMIGSLDIGGHLERSGKDAPPTGFLNIDTHGFAMQTGATRIEGIDFRLRTILDGKHNEDGAVDANKPVQLSAVVEAHDAKGPLAIVHIGTEGLWSTIRTAGKGLADLPIGMNIIMPPRDLDHWPRAIAKTMPVHGKLGVVGHAEGTIGKPKLDFRARLENIADSVGGVHDAEVTLTYDGALAKLLANVSSRAAGNKQELALEGEVKVKSGDLVAGGTIPWTAKLDAKLDELPLELFVTDTAISGKARGELHVDHINDPAVKAASVEGRIDVDKFQVGDTTFSETFFVVKVDESAANATLALHGKDGALDAKAHVPLVWKNAASPAIAPGAPIEATLDAKDLRLKVAEPFVDAVDKLDGKVNAHITAKVTKKTNADGKGTYEGAPEGTISLREGVIIADAVGERWDQVVADVSLHNNKIELPKIELRGRTGGYAKMSGSATLDGFFPKSFHARADLKRFSFASEGAKVGDITGTIVVDGKTVKLADKRDQMVVDVTLDPFLIDLAAEAGKQVQQLDQDPSIMVAEPLGPPIKPPGPPGTGTAMKVAIHMPHSVMIRRDDLRIAAEGNPSIDIDGPAKFAGEVRINGNPASNLQQRSWLEVSGKRFYIQQSRIAFDGSEDFDPLVDVEVRWQAPDRTIVQVRVTGHLKTPKVTFKGLDESGSPLGLTQGEVMSLIVLGRRDAGSAKQQEQAEKGAAAQTASLVQGMTGAIVGKQLQKMLPASMSLSLAPGRYSGGYQHNNIYFEVAYNASGSRMGPQAIGQTIPRTTFGIEWRFAKMWSLMTTIGDTGSTLVDLLWHYRY